MPRSRSGSQGVPLKKVTRTQLDDGGDVVMDNVAELGSIAPSLATDADQRKHDKDNEDLEEKKAEPDESDRWGTGEKPPPKKRRRITPSPIPGPGRGEATAVNPPPTKKPMVLSSRGYIDLTSPDDSIISNESTVSIYEPSQEMSPDSDSDDDSDATSLVPEEPGAMEPHLTSPHRNAPIDLGPGMAWRAVMDADIKRFKKSLAPGQR